MIINVIFLVRVLKGTDSSSRAAGGEGYASFPEGGGGGGGEGSGGAEDGEKQYSPPEY